MTYIWYFKQYVATEIDISMQPDEESLVPIKRYDTTLITRNFPEKSYENYIYFILTFRQDTDHEKYMYHMYGKEWNMFKT